MRTEFEAQLSEAKDQLQEVQNSYTEETTRHNETKEILDRESRELCDIKKHMTQTTMQLQQCEKELTSKSKDLTKYQDLLRLSKYNESLLTAVLDKCPHVLESVTSSSH